MAEQEGQEISIEDLELSLEVYEIQAEEKVKKLQELFKEKSSVDLGKMFYQDKSSLEIKFQNIISDLTEFLINQQIASTDKLRKTFYRILENPMTFLFKVSRFEIFNLRLNAFDIQLEPIDAVCQVGSALLNNIDKHESIVSKLNARYDGTEYKSFEQFLQEAQIRVIHDLLFTFYSYLRKGGKFIKKKFEDKVRVVQMYNQIEKKMIKGCIQRVDSKTLKQLSLLNYEIYLLQNSYDVLCFYLKVPFRSGFAEVFRQLQTLGEKAKQNSNYDLFILIFLRYTKEIMVKLDVEGIDSIFSNYIENALTSILDLWGCRLCYYQQFYELFYKLLLLHPNKAVALQICLKYNPELKKDDIVLLRTNFKHELVQKQSELLSLLKSKSMEEVNTALSSLYHQTLYTLDFKDYSREQIINLVNLLNGNTSFKQFFAITERAFRQWNHSIDFTNPHKYIQGEFKFPSIDQSKINQSLRLLNNLCILESKNQNDFEQIVKAGSIQRIFIGFVTFLFTNQKTRKLITDRQDINILFVNIIQFLKRIITNNGDWQPVCLVFSSHLKIIAPSFILTIIITIKDMITQNFSSFSIKSLIKIFKNIINIEKNLQNSSISSTYECIINNFMKGIESKNEQVKKFKFFGTNINEYNKITKSEEIFLKEYALLNNNIIEVKNTGCFTLSELQIITNPVQFDKVMDNYYFSLDKNAKRFIQYLTIDWVQSTPEQLISTISILKQLIKQYPISIPILCSTRIQINNEVSRFIEYIVKHINEDSLPLVKQVIECRCIKYKNGKDYIREEILPLILKQTIKKINQSSNKVQHYQLLALVLKNSSASDIKIDLIQNSIDAIRYQVSICKNEQQAFRLSKAHLEGLRKFFDKKEKDMRKMGLKDIFQEQIWHENRIKSSSLHDHSKPALLKKININEQIMITPYTAPHDYEASEVKMENYNNSFNKKKVSDSAEVNMADLQKTLTNKSSNINLNYQKKNQNLTTIDLSNLKYDIQSHLGPQILKFCRKQGYRIITAYSDGEAQGQINEQNITFVQYYLKQFQVPEVSAQLVLQYLYAMLINKVQYGTLFSNLNNVQKLFSSLILILGHCVKKIQVPNSQNNLIDKILSTNKENKNITLKAILKILSAIGYTNLWSQSYNTIKQLDYLKQLRSKCQFTQQSEEQTFFSWVLRTCLQNEEVKQELNDLLGSIFTTRPKEQNSLMYKVTLNRALLNLIMKSLEISNLSYVSLLFHSNYNNLRLYTDQLHQGLKALNMASKNRAYNQYVQLSKDLEDQEFYQPMKLFKQNFNFFISIQAEGYRFKRNEEQKIGRERVLKALRSGITGQKLCMDIEKIIDQFQVQLQKLQSNIASRVKAFYLATKLRDLSYQNSITICLLYQILSQNKESQQSILSKINYIQLFSLMIKLYNTLVRFDKSEKCENFLQQDISIVKKDVNICSTRRYSHSMSKVYEKCDLQLDEVIQRCIDGLKYFFTSKIGKQWLSKINIFPPFLTKSFIELSQNHNIIEIIKTNINSSNRQYNSIQLTSTETDSFVGIVKGLRQLKKGHILSKDKVKIKWSGTQYSIDQFLVPLKNHLFKSETLIKSKDGFLLFNKYKTSEKTLEQIELFGVIVGYCIFWNIQMDLALHSSLLSAIGFGLCDLQDLLDVDFKVWQDLRNVMSISDSKTLNLNFSYNFESLQTLKTERIQLTDKGTSKKVNNLNREQYCDLVCCYLLYKTVNRQLNRFLDSICYVCPKQLLASLNMTDLHQFFIKKHPKYSEQILRQYMKKRGLVLPDTVLSKGKRIENLKDYQSIQWICEIVDQNAQLKDKIWKNQSNIFVCIWMGQGVEYDFESKMLLLGRFKDKEDLKRSLMTLK